MSKKHYYPAEDITIEFEARKCIHAAECVRGLPAVFDPQQKPWVDVEGGDADTIAEVVARCPSGALQVRRTDGGEEEPIPAVNRVRVVPEGPLYCTGDLKIELNDGRVLNETRVALCRCGASKNKPFCDNSHQKAEFADPAVTLEDRLKPVDGEASGPLTLRLAANGPVLLAGPVTLTCDDGSGSTGSKGALCRCGASATKPYCDGSHKSTGFEAD